MKLNLNILLRIFTLVSIIGLVWGIIFTLFGFTFFPAAILPRAHLLSWVSSIYGSILVGWSVTLILLGRLAFRRKDTELMNILNIGIFVWLLIEAVASFATDVYFNIGVDILVFLMLTIPLRLGINTIKKEN